MSVQEDVFGMATNLLDSIKDLNIRHILGGILPISDPSFVIAHELINQICIYEGEGVVEDAINCLKNNKPLSTIKGTWFKDITGNIHKNPPQPLTNIMKVIPDFSCFEGMRWKRTMGGEFLIERFLWKLIEDVHIIVHIVIVQIQEMFLRFWILEIT